MLMLILILWFTVPWWAEVHIFAGFVFFYWILTPILYYTNVSLPPPHCLLYHPTPPPPQSWSLAYFPLSANGPYDRFGQAYNVTKVLKPDDTFDLDAYAQYSPLFLPATYVMTYLLAFALCTCVIVHTLLYHGRSLVNGIKRIRVEQDDIHAKLMRNYPEVPDWWYALAFVGFFSLAIVACEVGSCVCSFVLAFFFFSVGGGGGGFVRSCIRSFVRAFCGYFV